MVPPICQGIMDKNMEALRRSERCQEWEELEDGSQRVLAVQTFCMILLQSISNDRECTPGGSPNETLCRVPLLYAQ